MTRTRTDILIAGGGIAGMTAAASFAAEGFSVICVDPAPPTAEARDTDLRSTAFLMPSVALLEEAGLWPGLSHHATALTIMRIIDAGGDENEIRATANFDAAEIGQEAFGYNLPNTVLRKAIAARLDTLDLAEMRHAARLTRVTPRTGTVIAALSDGSQVEAQLLVAADGRDSFVREALGIGVRRWGYGQKALVFSVRHALPHDNISTEIHRSGGPFTLVPLPDHDGAHHSAVVWMERGGEAARLAVLPQNEFETELNTRALGVLGPLTLASDRALWPIISQVANSFSGPRTALIAEAAHVVPPIGAQGLNTSLADIATLRDLLAKARETGKDIASPALLDAYSRKRHTIVQTRTLGIDLLNRAAMTDIGLLKDLRLKALKTIFTTTPIRRSLMRLGMG